jgi:hypothetical protein
VKETERSFPLITAPYLLIALLLMANRLPAQQAQADAASKQEVPNNPLAPAGPVQPIPFGHKTHVALGLQCQNCHTNPAPGTLMAFPATSTCMQCHATVAKDKPAIEKLADYDMSRKPVPWVRVYNLGPGYEWSHRKHLDAGIACEACHGQVARMDVTAEVTSVVTMYSCLECHVKHKASTTCTTCHRYWPADRFG